MISKAAKTVLTLFVFFLSPILLKGQVPEKELVRAASNLKKWKNPLIGYQHIAKPAIDSVRSGEEARSLNVYFPRSLTYYPFRESDITIFESSLRTSLGRRYRNYSLAVYSNGYKLTDLIPNLYREAGKTDNTRIIRIDSSRSKFITRNDFKYPVSGLSGKNIALWHSHGYYYEQELDRWEWQRARLFSTVEDISVMGFVLPYLSKMLENAGAYTLIPRERDTNKNEVIADNDISTGKSEVVLHLKGSPISAGPGFLKRDTLFTGENPFRMGTSLLLDNGYATFLPDIGADGEYAVYVSWPANLNSTDQAVYEIRHAGGMSSFSVDQTKGAATWIFLGKFRFLKGKNESFGSVKVFNGKNSGLLGIDAVKFGGGMGNIARKPAPDFIGKKRSVDETSADVSSKVDHTVSSTWKTSGKPRFTEGARYFLQYSGMPDSLVYTPNLNRNDYNDDYQCRGIWVNYISSTPKKWDSGTRTGLGIPVDLSFAFHTDAGVTDGDSVIGTLAIYSTGSGDRKFPGGESRMASRDLSDIVQTQIVDDIRALYKSDWTRRGLWDRPYSEATRPEVPSMLLELLSHQNKADMIFGLDPAFRFDISRSIYKGILKYFAFSEGRKFVVQPLPVDNFSVLPTGSDSVILSWEPVEDLLEKEAMPASYRVYIRKNNLGFDNGIEVKGKSFRVKISPDTVYSFKVAAVNDGGESFGSEILAAGRSSTSKGKVLIVNGFDRVSGPSWFDTGDMAGIEWWKDRGVPYAEDIVSTGDQYDFLKKSEWVDDDSPGWGASDADREGTVTPGNTFDFAALHGRSVLNAGFSFYSSSDEAFEKEKEAPVGYSAVDYYFGEEKEQVFSGMERKFGIYTAGFMEKCRQLSENGVPLFLSGSYLGSDIKVSKKDSVVYNFARKTLHFSPRTGNAVNRGLVYPTDAAKNSFPVNIMFNAGESDSVYHAEYPDAIEPAGNGAFTLLRYSQNNTSAGVAHVGKYRVISLGFPFETVLSQKERDNLMKNILNFLVEK